MTFHDSKSIIYVATYFILKVWMLETNEVRSISLIYLFGSEVNAGPATPPSPTDAAYKEHDATINYEQCTTEAFEESALQMALARNLFLLS